VAGAITAYVPGLAPRLCHSLLGERPSCCFLLGTLRRAASSPAQKFRLPRGSVKCVVIGLLLAMLATSMASARTSQTRTVIYACYSTRRDSGELRLRSNRCGSTETSIKWNLTGVPGAAGATGSRGPTGPAGPTGRRGPAGGSWPDVAATLAGAVITALSALGAAALTNRVARRRLRDEQARANKAENEVRMRTFAELLTTARLFNPRELRDGNRRWEGRFSKQVDEVMLAFPELRRAAQQLRNTYAQMKARLSDALVQGNQQFNAEAISVAGEWDGLVDDFADTASQPTGTGGVGDG
jgi:hypothetical protein